MPTYSPVFRDPALEQQFTREGYVVIPMLDADEIATLRRLYQAPDQAESGSFYTTYKLRDGAMRRHIADVMSPLLKPHIERLMPGSMTRSHGIMVKPPVADPQPVPLHQDFTSVDLEKHRALQLWIPLIDVDESNGCLKLVAGSHSLAPHISAMLLNPSPYRKVREILDADATTTVPVKAGTAVLFDQRMLHGSTPNISGLTRVSVGALIIPADVKQLLFVEDLTTPGNLHVMEMEDEFAVELGGGMITPPFPEGLKHIGDIHYSARFLTEEEIEPIRLRHTVGSKKAVAAVPVEPHPHQRAPASGFFRRLFGG